MSPLGPRGDTVSSDPERWGTEAAHRDVFSAHPPPEKKKERKGKKEIKEKKPIGRHIPKAQGKLAQHPSARI